MIRGVIFDMDGLMTDTEKLFLDLWCEIMRERGEPEYREILTHCIGLDHGSTRRYIDTMLGPEFPYMEILGEVGVRSRRYCQENGVPVKPGLYELIDFLDLHGIPYGVATSTKGDRAKWRLDNIGVLNRLSALVTGDVVQKGKPEPDIFLKAAELLGVPGEECLVLEDSPHGILAAHRAGCMPLMIPDLKQPDEETKKLLWGQLSSLLEVPDYIAPYI